MNELFGDRLSTGTIVTAVTFVVDNALLRPCTVFPWSQKPNVKDPLPRFRNDQPMWAVFRTPEPADASAVSPSILNHALIVD